MKYFILNRYLTKEEKQNYKKNNLFCYDLRAGNNIEVIKTIEDIVIFNRYGSIITNEKLNIQELYPDDFIDFEEFVLNNTEVSNVEELYKKD